MSSFLRLGLAGGRPAAPLSSSRRSFCATRAARAAAAAAGGSRKGGAWDMEVAMKDG